MTLSKNPDFNLQNSKDVWQRPNKEVNLFNKFREFFYKSYNLDYVYYVKHVLRYFTAGLIMNY